MVKKRLLVIAVVIALGVLALDMSGCATNRIDLVKSSLITIERQHTGKVYIPWSDAYEARQELVINGVIRRRGYSTYPIKMHVDIIILAPDGAVLEHTRTQDRRCPGRSCGFVGYSIGS